MEDERSTGESGLIAEQSGGEAALCTLRFLEIAAAVSK